MSAFKLAQQLFRAAKRMKTTDVVATSRSGGDYFIRVHADNGAIYDVSITTYKEPAK